MKIAKSLHGGITAAFVATPDTTAFLFAIKAAQDVATTQLRSRSQADIGGFGIAFDDHKPGLIEYWR